MATDTLPWRRTPNFTAPLLFTPTAGRHRQTPRINQSSPRHSEGAYTWYSSDALFPPPSPPPLSPQALDTFPGSDEIIIGTDKCDIWKVELKRSGKELAVGSDGKIEHASRQMLVKGHADYLRGMDAHPTK
jgi:hypothetical protein